MSKRLRKDADQPDNGLPRPIRPSSARVYIAMWTRFLRWLFALTGKTVYDLTHDDLMAFLEYREQGKRVLQGATIRRKYLTLFERVFTHLRMAPNPAVHAGFDIAKNRSTLGGANAPKASLTEAEQVAFMRALPAEKAPEPTAPARGWKRRRDRAMQALMLGAGLKVSEAVGLSVRNLGTVDSTGSLPVSIIVLLWSEIMARAQQCVVTTAASKSLNLRMQLPLVVNQFAAHGASRPWFERDS